MNCELGQSLLWQIYTSWGFNQYKLVNHVTNYILSCNAGWIPDLQVACSTPSHCLAGQDSNFLGLWQLTFLVPKYNHFWSTTKLRLQIMHESERFLNVEFFACDRVLATYCWTWSCMLASFYQYKGRILMRIHFKEVLGSYAHYNPCKHYIDQLLLLLRPQISVIMLSILVLEYIMVIMSYVHFLCTCTHIHIHM